jgi:succinyl-CoA synthetase beta subunit
VSEAAQRSAPRQCEPLALSAKKQISEHEAKKLLAHVGVRVPRGELAKDVASVLAAASRIGYPVVMKIVSDEILHKTEVGGVVVVNSEAEVIRVHEEMLRRVHAARPEATVQGILVEEVVHGGVEMIIGARRDAAWGDTILIGLGGIWAEVLRDSVLVSANADRREIRSAIDSLRASAALSGLRSGVAGDVDALVEAVELIGAALRATRRCVEIEVNPLVVLNEGAGVVALDALVLTSD